MADKLAGLMQQREASRPATVGQAFNVGHMLPIEHIRTDGGTQARAALDLATVAEYAESWRQLAARANGLNEMPPIIVYYDGTDHWLADGFHRLAAYKQFLESGSASASPRAIRALVLQGTRRDAVLAACGANATHGLRRTNADKRRAIETLLKDDEWKTWSDSEVARRVNVDHKTVAAVRADLYPGNSQDSRTVERAGTTYQMTPAARTSAINRPDGSPAELPDPPDFDAAQARAGNIGYKLSRHGGWWQLEHAGYRQPAAPPADVLTMIARLETAAPARDSFGYICMACGARQPNATAPTPPICPSCAADKPNISETTPISVRTTDGTRETTPERVLGALALHPSALDAHIASGRAVAEFTKPLDAAAAFVQLAALDWSGVTDGHTGPDLRRQINEIVIQYQDARGHAERIAAQTAEPQNEEPRTENRDSDRSSAWHKEQQAIDDTALASAQICVERGNSGAARLLLGQVKVKTVARDALLAQIGDAPPPTRDPRTQAATLLRELAPLLAQIKTDDQEGLSAAICDLNECQEGTEAQHWLTVGWALLDLGAD